MASTVIEYKDTREILPAPLNILTFVCRLGHRLLVLGGLATASPPLSHKGYTWKGGGGGGGISATEAAAEARRHRRRQAAMCSRHRRHVEEMESTTLEAQVAGITERQTDMELKQESRLESMISGLASLKDGLQRDGVLVSQSPYPSPRIRAGKAAGAGGSVVDRGGSSQPSLGKRAVATGPSGIHLQHRAPPTFEAPRVTGQQLTQQRLRPLSEAPSATLSEGGLVALASAGSTPVSTPHPTPNLTGRLDKPNIPEHIAAKIHQQPVSRPAPALPSPPDNAHGP